MAKRLKKHLKKSAKTRNPIKTIFSFIKEIPLRTKLGAIFIFLVSVSVWLFWGLPLPTNLGSNAPISTKILDRNGKLIYEIFEEKRRTPIKLNTLPSYVKNATISIEDKDFYKHHGFSITGIGRALYNIVLKQNLQGGSTLTQQLVKITLLSPERTLKRKIRELVLTMVVEATYSKDQILELYLNSIPYGGTAYGIEAASELYFDKSAKDLDLAQAALLAGLPQSPTRYSPFGANPELAKQRQEEVLDKMIEEKYITKDEAQGAKDEKLTYAEIKAPLAPHFALWIKEQLADKYGDAVVEKGGLQVTTTLDLDLQNFAQDTVEAEVQKLKKQNVKNGGLLATNPKTGEILTMVGSYDYFANDEDGKVNIVFSKRQPGSSIKPINYALAIKDGKITPATVLADVPTCFDVLGQAPYCPKNYDDKFHGGVEARFALGNSYNIPAVRVLALNGLENFISFAQTMGLTTLTDPKNYGLSLTLGGGEVRLYDMAEAYGVFANEGIKEPLKAILKVTDSNGKVLEENKPQALDGDRVLDEGVAFLISHMLLDNNARVAAFGESSYLNVTGHGEVSVKTGTTNDRRDNWTIGYSGQMVVATWVGNNDNSEMSGAVSGISGASPIWNKVIKFGLDKAGKGAYDQNEKGTSWPKQPENVIGAQVCATTGILQSASSDQGCPARFEYFLKDHPPKDVREGHMDLQILKGKNMVAPPNTPSDQFDLQNHPFVLDPLGTTVCLDCSVPDQPISIHYPL